MASIQEHLIEKLGSATVRSILEADGPAGKEPFINEDDPPHPQYRERFKVERSFNRRAVLLIVDDSAAKRWEDQQQNEEEPHGVPPETTLRLTFSDSFSNRRAGKADSDSDFYDPLEEAGL
jgi:hypothetical protein